MSDLISRDDAIRELSGACSNWEDDAKVQEIVMAIPSTKPTGDLISRADAIEAVHKYFVKEIDKTPHEIDEDGFDVYTDMPTVNSLLACNKELSKELKALPSAEAVQGWIPCSERLPECGFSLHYLVTLKDGHDFMDDVYEAFFDKYGWHLGDNELADDDVIAWMPLPTPYKGGEEE